MSYDIFVFMFLQKDHTIKNNINVFDAQNTSSVNQSLG